MNRRTMLGILGGGAAALLLRKSLWAAVNAQQTEYFIFIHAGGGWDVTLWSDPRNQRKGIVEPASNINTEPSRIKLWKNAPLDGGGQSFEIVEARGGAMRFGPAIGDLYDVADRITLINGIAMNTVSHDDGTVYSATGRHRSGGIVPQPSIDVMIASELGSAQLMPDASIRFPSFFVGDRLDRRAIPVRVATVDSLTKSFERSKAYITSEDRDAVDALLSDEAHRLGAHSVYPETYEQLASQHEAMPELRHGDFANAFSSRQLKASYPQFPYGGIQAAGALGAAFAIEAIKRDVVRSVAFGLGGLDTHSQNYRQHAFTLQEAFGVIATLLKTLDDTPHPHRDGARLSEHTHILVISEFCRTPQINLAGGRDHYPNNSALVISPKFRGGRTFGRTDPEQVLPTNYGKFASGERALTPEDVLATFLGAFGIDPRVYMRDGEVVKEMLA